MWGQQASARVMSGGYSIKGVLAVNVREQREAKTDSLGIFRLKARVDDTIIITDPGIIPQKIIISNEFFQSVPIINVELSEVYVLDEITVNKYSNINAEALGLAPKGQKRYTPQERKLYTAGDFKPIHLLGLLGGNFPLDPVMNAINGRTRMLKKTVAVERKESAIEILNSMFTADEVEKEYGIPKEYVQGFFYYCVEDTGLVAVLKANNDIKARFIMSGLALSYLETITVNPDKDEK